jgi:hypothetical protein
MNRARDWRGGLTGLHRGQFHVEVAQPFEAGHFDRHHTLADEPAHRAFIVVQRIAVGRLVAQGNKVVVRVIGPVMAIVIGRRMMAGGRIVVMPLAGMIVE